METTEIRARLRAGLMDAMRERDAVARRALRSALAAIDNAEAVPSAGVHPPDSSEQVAGAAVGVGSTEAARAELTRGKVHSILDREIRERLAAAEEYRTVGRDGAADDLDAEARVIWAHLTVTDA